LLVVIAIVAILISLLLPALNRARWESIIVKCEAQMKQIGQSAVNYATDNGDFFPPYRGFRGYAIRINTFPSQWNATNAGQNNTSGGAYLDPTFGMVMQNVAPGTLLNGANGAGPFPQYETCNIGRLYQTGYMTNLSVAFDPAFGSDSVLAAGNTTNSNWGPNRQFYSSYIFNPHAAYMPAIDDREGGNSLGGTIYNGQTTPAQPLPGVPILYNPYATAALLPPTKCLMIDVVNNYSVMAHTYGIKAAAVNVLFGDCHVQRVSIPTQVIQCLMQIAGTSGDLQKIATAAPGATGGTYPTTGSWTPLAGFEWGIAPSSQTAPNTPVSELMAPSAVGTQGVSQQPFLDSYIDLFEVLANGGDATHVGSGNSTPLATDLYGLNSGLGAGLGRVINYIPG